uniref:ankyrin repeat domain-containing protein n=1 Tax=Brachyspira catarrhinii TaxID=2528966 RepID=UPI003F4B811D
MNLEDKISNFLYKKYNKNHTQELKNIINLIKENYKNLDMQYILTEASKKLCIEIIELVLRLGADINAKNKYGYTALCEACLELDNNPKESTINKRLEIVKYLINRGADVNGKSDFNFTPLIYASSSSGSLIIVDYLVRNGAEINFNNSYGYSPLCYACKYGYFDTVKYLVEKGSIINFLADKKTLIKNEYGTTPLIEASNYSEIVKYLIKNNANVNFKDYSNRTPLMKAAYFCNLETVKYFIENDAEINVRIKNKLNFYINRNFNALKFVIYSPNENKLPIIKYLLSRGIETDKEDLFYIFLMETININDNEKYINDYNKKFNAIVDIIDNLFNTDKKKVIKTYIEKIIRNDDLHLLDYIYKNYDIKYLNDYMISYSSAFGSIKLVKYLIENNAYINNEVLIYAAEHYELMKYFIEIGVKINDNIIFKIKTYDILKLFDSNRLINIRNKNNDTLLIEFCNEIYYYEEETEIIKIIKFLIESGIDINAQNNKGCTALMYACTNESFNIVKILLENKADIYIKDNEEKTALSYSNKDIRKYLSSL